MTNKLVLKQSELDEVLDRLQWAKDQNVHIGMDYETSGFYTLVNKRDFICGQSWSIDGKDAWYVPLAHDNGINFDEDVYWSQVKPFMEAATIVAHNALFELKHTRALSRFGTRSGQIIDIQLPNLFCTQTSVMLTGTMERHLSCKDAIRRLTGKKRKYLKDLFDGDEEKIYFPGLDPRDPDVLDYACDDAIDTWTIHSLLHPRMKDQLLYKVDQALTSILYEMYENGWPVDKTWMAREVSRLRMEAEKVSQQINRWLSDLVGTTITVNPVSSQAVGNILFNMIKLPAKVLTPGGKPSTSAYALEELAPNYPYINLILTYRSLMKLASTYYEGYQEWIDPLDYLGCEGIRPNYIPHIVPTHRTASKDPNMQNVPEKTIFKIPGYSAKDGKTVYPDREIVTNVRDCWVAPKDYFFLFADYSQIEFRILIGEAGETDLINAVNQGQDLHASTAAKLYGKRIEDITKEERDKAKTMNFALLYGQGAFGMSQRMGWDIEIARKFISDYFAAMPNVAKWLKAAKARYQETGFVKTKFGFTRQMPDWQNPIPAKRNESERGAINTIIQGTAADLLRIALYRLNLVLKKHFTPDDASKRPLVRLCLETHDDVGLLCHKSVDLQKLMNFMTEAMCVQIPGYPKIEIEFKAGISWGQTEKLKTAEDWNYEEQRNSFVHVGAVKKEPVPEAPSNGNIHKELPVGPCKIRVTPQDIDLDKFKIFKQFLGMYKGENIITLHVEGDDVDLVNHPTSLSVADKALMEENLGPCKVELIGSLVDEIKDIAKDLVFA